MIPIVIHVLTAHRGDAWCDHLKKELLRQHPDAEVCVIEGPESSAFVWSNEMGSDRESRISAFDRESGFDCASDEGRASWVRTSFDRAVSLADDLGLQVEKECKALWRAWRKRAVLGKLVLLRTQMLALVGACFMLGLTGCSADTFTGSDGGDAADQSDAHEESLVVGLDGGDGASADTGGSGDVVSGDGYDGHTLPPYRRVFITSKTFSSNFGGLSVADKACSDAAKSASLGGNWAAWLSTKATSAASRLEHATVPYQLLDGTQIATNWTALTFGSLSASINMDEHEKAVPLVYYTSGFAWTGTNADGTTNTAYTDSTCSDWTYMSVSDDSQHVGACGLDTLTNYNWTAYASYCETAAMLSFYCIEQP
jgi:hypothetical protein